MSDLYGVVVLFFSLSGSTPSVSSCSSRGSLSLSGSRGSLSASSRGSLNSLNYTDLNHSGGSETPNLRELHQRVTDMLQGMSRDTVAACQPMHGVRTTGVPTSYTPTSGKATHPSASNSSQVSLSSRDSLSLSSHSPPISPSTSDRSPTLSPATARVVASEGENTAGLDGTELERSLLLQVSFLLFLSFFSLSFCNADLLTQALFPRVSDFVLLPAVLRQVVLVSVAMRRKIKSDSPGRHVFLSLLGLKI